MTEKEKKKDLRSNLEHPHLNETFNSNEFFKSAKIQKDLEKDVKYLSLFNKNGVVFVLYDPALFFKDDFFNI